MSDALAYALQLEAEYRALKLRRSGPSWPATANRTSAAGHPCTRYLVLERTASERKPPIDVAQAMRFDEGRIQEKALLADLLEMGAAVEGYQRAHHDRARNLIGHPDFRLGGYIADAKSLSDRLWTALETVDDFLRHPYVFVRAWAVQVRLYVWLAAMAGEAPKDEALVLCKNKESGRLRVVPVPPDGPATELILEKLDRVNAHVASGTLPPELDDPDVCPRCPYWMLACYGESMTRRPTVRLAREEVAAELGPLLDRWWALRDPAAEYAGLDEERRALCDALGLQADEKILVGPYLITKREIRRRGYTVADGHYVKHAVLRLEGLREEGP